MDQSELLPGVLLQYLKENQPIALGSAKKCKTYSGENGNQLF
jgi:hypothetical protein